MADAKTPAAKPPANKETDVETGNQMAGTSGEKSPAEGVNEVDLAGTKGVVDERLEKLNEANKEGHEKNMKAIEQAAKPADGEDGESKTDPRLGKEDNGCTPRVNKDGSKSWFPPGVAGAPVA